MDFLESCSQKLNLLKEQGLYKEERTLTTPQGNRISTDNGLTVLNFCSNNYLGLANHPNIIKAAQGALDTYGFGLASVRFICGTQSLHKEFEAMLATFFQMEDAILYSFLF